MNITVPQQSPRLVGNTTPRAAHPDSPQQAGAVSAALPGDRAQGLFPLQPAIVPSFGAQVLKALEEGRSEDEVVACLQKCSVKDRESLMAIDRDGMTVLLKALQYKQRVAANLIVQKILEGNEGSTNALFTAKTRSQNTTELSAAALWGYEELVEKLIVHSSKSALCASSTCGKTAVMILLLTRQHKLARQLVDKIIETHAGSKEPIFEARTILSKRSELMCALEQEDWALASCLIPYSSPQVLLHPTREGRTVLMEALDRGQIAIARAIVFRILEIYRGIYPKKSAIDIFKARNGYSELYFALKHDDMDLIKLLIKYSSLEALMVFTTSGETPLRWFVRREQPELAQLVLRRMLKLSAGDVSPIFKAMSLQAGALPSAFVPEQPALIASLLQHSSLETLTTATAAGETILIQALLKGEFGLAQLVINRIIELSPPDAGPIFKAFDKRLKYSEIMFALHFKCWAIIPLLIQHSSREALSTSSANGVTALMMMFSHNQIQLAQLHVSRLFVLSPCNEEPIFTSVHQLSGTSELMYALRMRSIDLAIQIVSRSSLKVLTTQNRDRETSLMHAMGLEEPVLVRAILDRILMLEPSMRFTARNSFGETEISAAIKCRYWDLAREIGQRSPSEFIREATQFGTNYTLAE